MKEEQGKASSAKQDSVCPMAQVPKFNYDSNSYPRYLPVRRHTVPRVSDRGNKGVRYHQGASKIDVPPDVR